MLKIVPYDQNKSYRMIPHSPLVFHAAQEGITFGEGIIKRTCCIAEELMKKKSE